MLLVILFRLSSAKTSMSPLSKSPRLFEKRLVFPVSKLADNESQEELGQYAGSFKLPRAYDARFVMFWYL